MAVRFRIPLLLLCLLALGAIAPPARARVVLIGIDGLGWSAVDPLVEAGEMPNLARLLARGASADLETVEPVVSPVVWTSIATGRRPDAHGVGGFLSTRIDLRVPTVFERLSAGGRRVGLYDYLVTWPPPALPDGFVVPGWMRRGPEIWPEDVWTRAGVSAYRVEYDQVRSREEHVLGIRTELARKPGTFAALLRAWEPDVAATIFYAVDRSGHRFWRDAWPADYDGGPRAPLPREGSVIRDVLRKLDAGLGTIAAALGPDDVILLASDHGFQKGDPRIVWAARIREHLPAADLDPERDGFSVVGQFGAVMVRVHPGPFAEREATLERLAAFFAGARGPDGEALVAVQVLDSVERPPEHRRSLWQRIRQRGFRLAAWLLFDTEFEGPAHAWLVVRFDSDRMEELWPEGPVQLAGRTLRADDVVLREDFDGTHHPTAVFAAAGGPIRPSAERGTLSVLDVAPLIAYLAGAPVPDDMEGVLPIDWIEPAWLAAHPPRALPAADAPRLEASEAVPAPAVGDPEMVDRLRSLGYLD